MKMTEPTQTDPPNDPAGEPPVPPANPYEGGPVEPGGPAPDPYEGGPMEPKVEPKPDPYEG